MRDRPPANCSFCARSEREAKKILFGPAISICEKCVLIAIEGMLKSGAVDLLDLIVKVEQTKCTVRLGSEKFVFSFAKKTRGVSPAFMQETWQAFIESVRIALRGRIDEMREAIIALEPDEDESEEDENK